MMKKIGRIISMALLALLLVIASMLFLPLLLGFREMAVISGSMEPNIPTGSVVYIRPVAAEQLKAGDVCTYALPDSTCYVTHRVIEIDTSTQTLKTQGDANHSPDGKVPFSQVLGAVQFHLPYIGYLSVYLKSPTALAVICGIFFLILLSNFLPPNAKAEKKRANPKASGKAEEQ